MIKIDYVFGAKTPLHTGSDNNFGTSKMLRRQKVILKNPIEYFSVSDNVDKRKIIINILYIIYKSIDFSKIKGKRLMRIWSEFHSKVLKASMVNDKVKFFTNLCNFWDITSIRKEFNENLSLYMDMINSYDLLTIVRNELNYMILKLRGHIAKEEFFIDISVDGDETGAIGKSQICTDIPCISGNSIRGVMRRLVMRDFLDMIELKQIDKSNYHMLFSGGVLNQSTKYEDIDKRRKLLDFCPMLGVFGSAIGNMTISGLMGVGFAYPICMEMGNSDRSFWEYIDMIFQTRLDDFKIMDDNDNKDAIQMKYEYEVFIPGTSFSHSFKFIESDELLNSAFWRAIKLFKQNPHIGGMFSVGNSEIDLSGLVFSEESDQIYVDYVISNKLKIKEFFNEFK